MKHFKKILLIAVLSIPSLAYTENQITVKLMTGKNFGDYGIEEVTLRASCDTNICSYHKNTSSIDNIHSKKTTEIEYRKCRNDKKPDRYELKLLDKSGDSHSCGRKDLETYIHYNTGQKGPKRPKSIQITHLGFSNLNSEGYRVHCTWNYAY